MNRLVSISAFILFFIIFSSNSLQCVYIDTVDNSREYENMNVLLVSRIFNSIDIKGDHYTDKGFGFDQKIYLNNSDIPRIFGLLLIYNDSSTVEKNFHGGWIHTTIEMSNFTGYMDNQNTNRYLFLAGSCEYIKLTAYRV